jgi:hypothetical protein
MITETRKFIVLIIATLLSISACGGSSGDSAQSPPPPPPPPAIDDPVGGITRTGVAFAVGPVTGFGSVIVNGIAYDTSNANFTVDGEASTQSALKVGQVVLIKGSIDDDNTNAVADSVEYEDLVEGPVTSIVDEFTIVVLGGQTVRMADAILDDSCGSQAFTSFASVEVSGTVLGDGAIDASFIDCKAVVDDEFEVNGVVSFLDNDTFMINQLVVNFTDNPAAVDDFPTAGMISDGDPVEVKGTQVNANDEFVATRVEYKGGRLAGDDGDHFEIEGFITNFASSSSFEVGAFSVRTDENTSFEGGVEGDLGPNVKVEIEGERDGNSILATKIDFKRGTGVRLSGLVDMLDGNDPGAFFMLGIRVTTDAVATRFDDKTGVVPDEQFGVDDIAAGNYVEVRGQEFPAGSGELAAVIVERDDLDGFAADENILRGFVEDTTISQPNLTVLGVTIATGAGTQFRNQNDEAVDENTFWTQLVQPGSLVKAKGVISGSIGATTLTADELEIETQ